MNITMTKPMESLRLKKTGPSVSGFKSESVAQVPELAGQIT